MGTISRMNLREMVGITLLLTEFHSSKIQCCGPFYRNHCVWGGGAGFV